MNAWTRRGLVFAVAMVIVRLLHGAMINAWQTQAIWITLSLLTLFLAGVVVWAVLDGRADARGNPDPDRRADLAMTWLLAGLAAGFLSGAVVWLISLFYKDLPTDGLFPELTTVAAFTALVVFLPGVIGVAVGRWRVDRSGSYAPSADGSEDRADTDVFTAVRDDTGAPAHETAEAEHQAHAAAAPTAVATLERDAPTEVIPTTEHDPPTEVIRTGDPAYTFPTDAPTESFTVPRNVPAAAEKADDDKTQVIKTHDHTEGKTEKD
jgi:hypothetical protein